MKVTFLSLALLVAVSMAIPAYSQVGQDLKAAGQDTKDAAKTGAHKTGHAVKKGATKSTHAVKSGTHKAASETAKGANKVEDKTSDTKPKP